MSVKLSISNEPLASDSMDLYRGFHLPLAATGEKSTTPNLPPPYSEYLHQQEDPSSAHECHNASRCHSSNLKRVLLPVVLTLVSLGALVALSCVLDTFFGGEGAGGLLKRATGSTTSGSGTFVNHKLYLIIVFVGLFLVVILGICLSAWCCRGSFENPLCCPCYLCACCGGLGCLECIACGLCAEGIEQA
ncbi:hypothetical protein BT96DRAFT_71295 [Gymnopus androsaceus JB14]|uniref:Transmembrane protein n=1 Tax=Gymnopus androsaceus JB14 TaxID=1447944 RepID=A0A6A4HIL2_9AGAR|nr:hypothetical protein BT96DRAFT_71295 [Gymnopus androsaceus JB14]